MISRRFPALLALIAFAATFVSTLLAQEIPEWSIRPWDDNGWAEWSYEGGPFVATNGVTFLYPGVMLSAWSMTIDNNTGEIVAEGQVKLQREGQVSSGHLMRYNFLTHETEAIDFKSGKAPVFISGHGLHGDFTNRVYSATNAVITSDDVSNPAIKVRAKSITVVPGKKIKAQGATLYAGPVPIFWFPFYSRDLGPNANNFNFVPGYRNSYGPFVLSSYNFYLNQYLDGAFHFDYRERRGPGVGPDFNYHLGKWGDGSFNYYYTHDSDPSLSDFTNNIPNDRQRIWFSYLANPYTNFSVRSMVRWQGDEAIVHDFFEREYRQNPQPSTFVEANKFWENWSVDAYAQPRVNDFYDTVERIPDIRLTGYRQQVFETPLYYESQSSAGYYRRLFAETNGFATGLNYEASRADSYHQVLMPETFFGWLNFTPRVGGRFTYYSDASGPGSVTDEIYRGVFNTGAELSVKASRAWPAIHNNALEIDGLRHIIEPALNYVYVPSPNHAGTNDIPQFDYELQSLRLLPIDFPDYNAIDSIDSQNVMRFGMRNKFQTRRDGAIVNLVNWDLYTDWRLKPRSDQDTMSDLCSDFVFRPRSWLTFESVLRYDVENGLFRLSLSTVTFKPNDLWSWSLSQFYVRDDFSPSPTAWGEGNNLFSSSLFFKLNENYALRMTHRYEARDSRLEEQAYSVYRDFRSWTAALTFRVRDNRQGDDDVGVAFTFSLKAFPRFGLGSDVVHPYYLLGS